MAPARPLDGIAIADFTQLVQGPFATQLLADLGADVIKIEPPGGDWLRHYAQEDLYPGGESVSFLAFNRNKRSIGIDLKQAEGLATALDLVATCDVVVENFRPGVMERLGLGPEACRERNAQLVYVSSSAYGSGGPYMARPGQDLMAQALSGVMYLTGGSDDPPTPAGISVADLVAGFHIALGVVAGLFGRSRDGHGRRLETDLLSALLAVQAQELTTFMASGSAPVRSNAGIASPYSGAPLAVYRCADGWLAIGMVSVARVAELVGVKGLEDVTSNNAVTDRDSIKTRIETVVADRPRDELVAELLAADIWCAPVLDYEAVVEDPQVRHNEMIIEFDHPAAGLVRTVGSALRYDAPDALVRRPPPRLGEHSRDVLASLGRTDVEIDRLLSSGAVVAHEERRPS